LQIDAIFPGFI